jgi:bacillithiol biosynthesis deacetylase BshB1
MKIVVFGIHPDDAELGCGGTVALCAAQGHDVVLVDLTRGESSSNGTPEEREREAAEAARILGCSARENLGLPDTGLLCGDPDQQRAVVSAIRRHRPDLAVWPSKDDPHPDHESGGGLIERAVYLSGIHGYRSGKDQQRWMVPNGLIYPGRRELEPDVVVDVSDTFKTIGTDERAKETPLNRPEFLAAIEARAVTAGHRIGARYGEAFKTLRQVGIKDLTVLVQ